MTTRQQRQHALATVQMLEKEPRIRLRLLSSKWSCQISKTHDIHHTPAALCGLQFTDSYLRKT